MRPLRIVVITGIFPPDIGGPATYVPRVASFLAERGHRVSVVTLSDVPAYHGDMQLAFHVVRIARRAPIALRMLATIATIVDLGWHADLLFVNGLQLETLTANRLLRKPLTLKVVGDTAWERARSRGWITDTFEEFQERRYHLKVELLRTLRAWWTRAADQVIAPSQYLAEQIQRWGVQKERIQVIYNSIDPPPPAPALTIPLHTPLKLLTVARLMPWKHIDRIIDAVARLGGVGLVVVGDGPERARLEALAMRHGINDRVYFAGTRSKPEVFALMGLCDIFVLNSTYEGFPHVLIEAMQAGMAVVATKAGGTVEVIEDRHTGRLIGQLNDQELYSTLAELIASTDERSRLADGARRAATRFNFKQMVETSAILLEQTAKRRGVR
ncbi:MAG TPA: glycosyltransferase family 4 protein [Roseiflexaceae bacterium]|nr:glycosyltransferase family 4 protein [Roseiflexaceae bacterium]